MTLLIKDVMANIQSTIKELSLERKQTKALRETEENIRKEILVKAARETVVHAEPKEPAPEPEIIAPDPEPVVVEVEPEAIAEPVVEVSVEKPQATEVKKEPKPEKTKVEKRVEAIQAIDRMPTLENLHIQLGIKPGEKKITTTHYPKKAAWMRYVETEDEFRLVPANLPQRPVLIQYTVTYAEVIVYRPRCFEKLVKKAGQVWERALFQEYQKIGSRIERINKVEDLSVLKDLLVRDDATIVDEHGQEIPLILLNVNDIDRLMIIYSDCAAVVEINKDNRQKLVKIFEKILAERPE